MSRLYSPEILLSLFIQVQYGIALSLLQVSKPYTI